MYSLIKNYLGFLTPTNLQKLSKSRIFYGIFSVYFISKVLYRLFLHPLNKIPGPWWARLTSIPYLFQIVIGNGIGISKKIHDKYGSIARVAPDKISVADTSNIKKMLSSYKYKKIKNVESAKIYHESIFSTRDETFNKMRRRQVGPAYSHTGLDTVENVIVENGILSLKKIIDSQIKQGKGSALINYSSAFKNLTTDVISALTFGKSFDAMKNNGHPIMESLEQGRVLTKVVFVIPHFRKFVNVVPASIKFKKAMTDYTVGAINERKQTVKEGTYNPEKTDILQMYLESVNTTNGKKLSTEELVDELVVTLIGGTDTTALTMTWLIHIYMLYPKVYKKVCNEVLEQFPDKSQPIQYSEARQKLPYLVASIYECMRLRAVSGGITFRETSAEGVELCGYSIPNNVDVALYFEGAHHDSKLNLAWYEILTVIPNFIRDYEISLPIDAIYKPNNLDPLRNNEPKFIDDIDWNPRQPRNEKRDCNIIIRHRVSN
ncbi:hypothetical protein BB558_000891 [Smittium angustum]|uniref:Cytochrome P450 n=1 Tax=Smittium angustum TaxID=133377 RepID=A0A2U1JD66_SMIAN|nr:hypothetical protein BB558_000891 [Smittium angustum]